MEYLEEGNEHMLPDNNMDGQAEPDVETINVNDTTTVDPDDTANINISTPSEPPKTVIQDVFAPAAAPGGDTTQEPQAVQQPIESVTYDEASQPAPLVPTAPVESTEQIVIGGESKPKKSRRKLLMVIAVLLVLVLAGGSASAYTFWYSNPKKSVYDAIYGFMMSSGRKITGLTDVKATSTSPYSGETTQEVKISYDVTATNAPSESADVGVEVITGGKTYNVGAKGIYMDNGDLYFRLENVTDLVKQLVGGSGSLPTAISDKINGLQGQWVKYGIDDMKKMSAEAGKAYQCVIDAYKDANRGNAVQKAMLENYEKHPFLLINEKEIQNKDGNYGYKVSIDGRAYVDYMKAVSEMDALKAIGKCGDNVAATNDSITGAEPQIIDAINEASKKVATTIWVNQWTHELKKIDVNYSDSNDSYRTSMTTSLDIKSDGNITVTAPNPSTPFSDWQTKLGELMQEVMGTMYGGYPSGIDDL